MRRAALALPLAALLLGGCSGAPVGHKTLRFEVTDLADAGAFVLQADLRAANGTVCNVGLQLAAGANGNVTCEGTAWPASLLVGAQYLGPTWRPGQNVTANATDRTIPSGEGWVARVTLGADGRFAFASGPDA